MSFSKQLHIWELIDCIYTGIYIYTCSCSPAGPPTFPTASPWSCSWKKLPHIIPLVFSAGKSLPTASPWFSQWKKLPTASSWSSQVGKNLPTSSPWSCSWKKPPHSIPLEKVSPSSVHAGKFPPALPPAPLIPLWCLCRAPPAHPALCLPSNLPNQRIKSSLVCSHRAWGEGMGALGGFSNFGGLTEQCPESWRMI